MRRIGDELALLRNGRLQPPEQPVGRTDKRQDFRWHALRDQRRQIRVALLVDLRSELLHFP